MVAGGFNLKRQFKDNMYMVIFLFAALMTIVLAGMTLLNMYETVLNINSAKENMNNTADLLSKNYEMRLYAAAATAERVLESGDFDELKPGPGSPKSHDEGL